MMEESDAERAHRWQKGWPQSVQKRSTSQFRPAAFYNMQPSDLRTESVCQLDELNGV
jgi:hypothetical protein